MTDIMIRFLKEKLFLCTKNCSDTRIITHMPDVLNNYNIKNMTILAVDDDNYSPYPGIQLSKFLSGYSEYDKLFTDSLYIAYQNNKDICDIWFNDNDISFVKYDIDHEFVINLQMNINKKLNKKYFEQYEWFILCKIITVKFHQSAKPEICSPIFEIYSAKQIQTITNVYASAGYNSMTYIIYSSYGFDSCYCYGFQDKKLAEECLGFMRKNDIFKNADKINNYNKIVEAFEDFARVMPFNNNPNHKNVNRCNFINLEGE